MMATERNKPSVIAKLMGLGEVPSKQQPVYQQQRVLSENYLRKSASIGSREKRSSKARPKIRPVLKKVNSTINDSRKDVSLRYTEQRSHSSNGNRGENGNVGDSTEERSDLTKLTLPAKVVVGKPSLGNVKNASKPSVSVHSHATFGWEFKKQLLERSKRTKVCQEIRSSIRVGDLVQMSSLPHIESKERPKLETQVVICSDDSWKDKSVTKLPILKRFNFSSSPNTKFKKMLKGDLSSSPGRHNKNNYMPTNSEDVELSCGDASVQLTSERIACNDSAKEGCFPCSLDVTFEQDSPCEDGFTTLNCIDMDDELPRSTGEAYQPSPNSVLEPDNSSSSENGDSVSTDLHGLWMKLQILKSESEENQSKPEMIISSDGDVTERSSLSVGQNMKPIRSFGPKESQEFSYLIDVLHEFEFNGGKMEVSFARWRSQERMMNPLLFETLEKKYGGQESWKKADRRLLFDRINLALSEILRPNVDFLSCSKPLRRKMGTMLRRDIIEEELWNLVRGQETEVNADLSEKAVGKEPWLELVDEVDSIAVEIEAFLFDKLAMELVTV